MNKIIPHNKPTLGKEEARAVDKVIKSNWIAQGKEVEGLENDICRFLKGKPGYAAAVSSGAAAIYLALRALGVKKGDEVILPSYVPGVLNSILLAQAKPILVDVNEDDFNISIEETKKKLSKKIKAIIAPHMFGVPIKIDELIKLGIPIIEDCAHAIGAKYKGKLVGTFTKVSIFSFYATKPLTTGQGGMIYSSDKNFINKVKDLREYDAPPSRELRFNFKMTDLHATIGRVQIRKFPQFLKKRKMIAREYYKAFPADKIWPAEKTKDRQAVPYRFLLRTKQPKKIIRLLDKQGIKTIIPFQPRELLHRYFKMNPAKFPVSEMIAKTTVSLPIYPSLTNSEIKYIIKNVKKNIF